MATALVGAVAQELVEQVAVGAMQFDPIETSHLGVFRRLAKARDDSGKLLVGKDPRNDVGLLTRRGKDFVTGNRQGAGPDRLNPAIE